MTTRREDRGGLDTESPDAARYLELAREIQHEVDRVAADDSAGADALDEVFSAITERERVRAARAVFERLSPPQQWAIIERVFGDEAIEAALAAERDLALLDARRRTRRATAAALARAGDRLDTRAIPPDELLTLGLFREADVRAAAHRGRHATNCARRLGLKATTEPGCFQVIEDVFNPEGGYFVTAQYDEDTWRTTDRLAAHALVRPGSIRSTTDGRSLDPVLHLGGRVDVEMDGTLREGRLHLAYALLDDIELFGESPR